MKIQQHPRMQGIAIGDEVYCHPHRLYARVEDVFPAAVCVKVARLSFRAHDPVELRLVPQLWRADDIENLSICRVCGGRDDLHDETGTGIPYRLCESCRVAQQSPRLAHADHP